MPYWAVLNPEDGKTIYELASSPRPVADPGDALPGEAVLSEWEASHPDWVWDSSLGSVREPTEQENRAHETTEALGAKVMEFFREALAEFVGIFPEARGDYSAMRPEEMYAALVALWLWTMEGHSDPEKQASVEAMLGKFRDKRAEVMGMARSGATPEEIAAERWDEG